VVEVVRDVGVSGALPPAQRPGWQRVMQLLESADGVVVYALDRVARSLWDLAAVVKELEGRGKLLLSVCEEWLQSVDPRVRQLIISILGWAAEMEREFIRERTREALARLKAEGRSRSASLPNGTSRYADASSTWCAAASRSRRPAS